jgi:hypothetical protein
MAQLNVTELDFNNIKQNLKAYLSSQEEFSDFNFEGSALNVLMDTLAYNTHYNGMLAHMLANENFLDSAIKRSSVVSLAKALGYTPVSKRAASARVNILLYPDPSYTPTVYTLSRDTQFRATLDGKSYVFYPQEDRLIPLVNSNGVDLFYFADVEIKEGRRLSNSFLIDSNSRSGPLVIPNADIDTTTLRVRVQNSATDVGVRTFVKKSGFIDVKGTDNVYFLEEGPTGLYQLRFGDGVIGQKLSEGNIVIIDYLNTSGINSNTAKQFTITDVLTGSGETLSVQTVSPASGGATRESVDSIKINAPRYNATKERAVTSNDYESLIKIENPSVQSVSVWGGEENDPPMYGKVFVSLNPFPGSVITENTKQKILTEIITPRAPIAIEPEFIDPEYTYVGVKTVATYSVKETALTSGQISAAVNAAIQGYFTTELNILNKSLYYSRLHEVIKTVSPSIISVALNLTIQKRISLVDLNAVGTLFSNFNEKIQPRTLHTTWFNAVVNTQTYKCKIIDLPEATVVSPNHNGFGKLWLQSDTGKNIAEIGTINYDTGKLTILKLQVSSLYGTETHLRLTVDPHNTTKDITTDILTRTSEIKESAVVAKPSKNTIITLNQTVGDIITGARSSFIIEAKPRVKETL